MGHNTVLCSCVVQQAAVQRLYRRELEVNDRMAGVLQEFDALCEVRTSRYSMSASGLLSTEFSV